MISMTYVKHEVLGTKDLAETENERVFLDIENDEIIIVLPDQCIVLSI